MTNRGAPIRRKGGPYALFLTNEDTGEIILDLHSIPEHLVEQIALFIGQAMPLAAAARAGVDAVRSLKEVGDALSHSLGSLGMTQPKRRVRGRR